MGLDTCKVGLCLWVDLDPRLDKMGDFWRAQMWASPEVIMEAASGPAFHEEV